jgi:archaellum biogenesis ATPase FlaH
VNDDGPPDDYEVYAQMTEPGRAPEKKSANVVESKFANILQLFEDMNVSVEEADEFQNPDFLYPNLVIKGHILVVPAEANGGKTTIFFHVTKEIALNGCQVIYINADISAGDAKRMIADVSKLPNFLLALPEIATVERMRDEREDGMALAVRRMQKAIQAQVPLDNTVLVVDTLKKAATPNDKKEMSSFLRLCRKLTARGATVILLAHTLKYEQNGLPMFEGVNDVKSDVDDLIYLVPMKRSDGSMIVSTAIDKQRGEFTPITFQISAEREVIQLGEYQDLTRERAAMVAREDDQAEIDEVKELLEDGPKNQTEIIKHLQGSRRQIRKMLAQYEGIEWTCNRGKTMDRNQKIYRLKP